MVLLYLSLAQVALESAAIIILLIAYARPDKPNKDLSDRNPFNNGSASLPAIMLWLAIPQLAMRVAKSMYDLYAGFSGATDIKDTDTEEVKQEKRQLLDKQKNAGHDSDMMAALRNSAGTLLLAGAGVIIGSIEHSKNLKDKASFWDVMFIIYACVLAVTRITDLLMDFRGDFMDIVRQARPDTQAGKDLRKYRAIATLALLGGSITGLLLSAIDNEGNNKGFGEDNLVYWIAFSVLCLHAGLAAMVVLAVLMEDSPRWEVGALNEYPIARSLVAGTSLFLVGLEFGALWQLAEPTFLTLSLVSMVMADGVGRHVA